MKPFLFFVIFTESDMENLMSTQLSDGSHD